MIQSLSELSRSSRIYKLAIQVVSEQCLGYQFPIKAVVFEVKDANSLPVFRCTHKRSIGKFAFATHFGMTRLASSRNHSCFLHGTPNQSGASSASYRACLLSHSCLLYLSLMRERGREAQWQVF